MIDINASNEAECLVRKSVQAEPDQLVEQRFLYENLERFRLARRAYERVD